MSGELDQRPPAIRYPVGQSSRRSHRVHRSPSNAWLAVLVVLAGGIWASGWSQDEAAPPSEVRCDEVRLLAHEAEQAAIATLRERNLLQTQLEDAPQFLTPVWIDRLDKLRTDIPAHESEVLVSYVGWKEALESSRDCFDRADLSFAQSRIRMVQALYG